MQVPSVTGETVRQALELSDPESAKTLDRLLSDRARLIFLVGAGISISSGMPPFKGPGSVSEMWGSDVLNAQFTFGNPHYIREYNNMIRELSRKCSQADPSAFHLLLSRLARQGNLVRLYSQNIDTLETRLLGLQSQVPLPQAAPYPPTVLLHGSLQYMACRSCQRIGTLKPEIFQDAALPPCPDCQTVEQSRRDLGQRPHSFGSLRARVSLYGEDPYDQEAIEAVVKEDQRRPCSAVLVVGTNAGIPGLQMIVRSFAKAHADTKFIGVNPSKAPPSNIREYFDLEIRCKADALAYAFEGRSASG